MSNRQSRHSTAGVVTTLWVSIPGRGKTFFSTLEHTQQLCGPTGLLFNEYWQSYPRCGSHWGTKLTTHVHLVPPLRESGTMSAPPVRFHGMQKDNFNPFFFNGNKWASWPIMCAEYQRFLLFEVHISLSHKTNSLHGLAVWHCHLQLFLMRLYKGKIRFLPTVYISVWTETSVLNHINFLILYYALFTSKSPVFLYAISSTYFMMYKLQWMKKLHIRHTVDYQYLWIVLFRNFIYGDHPF